MRLNLSLNAIFNTKCGLPTLNETNLDPKCPQTNPKCGLKTDPKCGSNNDRECGLKNDPKCGSNNNPKCDPKINPKQAHPTYKWQALQMTLSVVILGPKCMLPCSTFSFKHEIHSSFINQVIILGKFVIVILSILITLINILSSLFFTNNTIWSLLNIV